MEKNNKLFQRSLSEEMESAELGDKRLSQRLSMIVSAMAENPAQSFPVGLGSHAALEATYRFLRNPKVTHESVIAPHIEATVRRCVEQKTFLVLHDTSTFQFPGEVCRTGLGQVGNNKHQRGFFGHFSLAVAESAPHMPLGIIGMHVFRRAKKKKKYKNSWSVRRDPKREHARWKEMVATVEGRFQDQVTAIHVMDREADDYELYHQMVSQSQHFVNRLKNDRLLLFSNAEKLSEVWQTSSAIFEREVPLSRRSSKRSPRKTGRHPSRENRIAKLQFFAKTVRIKKTYAVHYTVPEYLTLNAVHIREVDATGGVEPVVWNLITTEPIDTAEEIMRIVDIYRARWIIEEYFKALKSGCAYEQRQMESYETLINALAIFAPIAWRLLLLRSLSRDNPDTDATEVLTPTEIEVLQAISKVELPDQPTVKEVMYAIARFGGHIKSNGPPGWLVLWRGYQKLKHMELGWTARGEKCDL
jgi:hypothetical protein